MRVAVIGAGQWGRNVIETFHALGALAAVVEADPAARAAVAARYPGVAVEPEPEAVFRSGLPAVAIATPAATHAALARCALLAGKDVFVEKPLTLAAREADELVALAAARDRVLMVGHMLLYQPAIQWIKGAIAEGLIGKVHALHQERLNLGRARAVENVLWSLGVHDVAVLLHLVGAPPTTIAASGQAVLNPEIEDDVHLHLGFPGQIQAHLHASWLWPEKRRRLTVIGSAGMLVYDELQQAVSWHRKGIDHQLACWDLGCQEAFRGAGEPLRLELEHFLACVSGRERPRSDGASGAAVVRVLEQAMALKEKQDERLLRA